MEYTSEARLKQLRDLEGLQNHLEKLIDSKRKIPDNFMNVVVLAGAKPFV